jgi:ribose transport system permease protein
VLISLILFFTILYPSEFFTSFNVRSIATIAAVTSFIAMGETYVIIGGGIDLSVGSVLVFSGIVSAEVLKALGGSQSIGDLAAGKAPPHLSLVVIIAAGLGSAAAAGAGWGILNGLLTVKAGIPDLIVTLGTLGAAYGLGEVITGGVDLNTPLNLTNVVGNGTAIVGVPWLVVIALAFAIVMQVVLSCTRFGRYTFALGSNREAGRRVGINVDRHRISLYVISGILAGCGGFFSLALYTTTTIGAHSTDNLVAIAAVIIGGTSLFGGIGTILGTIAGVLVPVVLQNGFVIMGLPPFWQPVAIGFVLVFAVWVDGMRRASFG